MGPQPAVPQGAYFAPHTFLTTAAPPPGGLDRRAAAAAAAAAQYCDLPSKPLTEMPDIVRIDNKPVKLKGAGIPDFPSDDDEDEEEEGEL